MFYFYRTMFCFKGCLPDAQKEFSNGDGRQTVPHVEGTLVCVCVCGVCGADYPDIQIKLSVEGTWADPVKL
jgi:hypothetical protein